MKCCLSCLHPAACSHTDSQKIASGYVCPLYEAAPEAVYAARLSTLKQFGVTTLEAVQKTGGKDE